MQIQLFVGNTMNLLLEGLQLEGEEGYVNDAETATVTILDRSGNEVGGEDWPVDLDYVASSNGKYKGVLSADIELVKSRGYIVEVVATKSGNKGKWRQTVTAIERPFS